MTDTLGVGLRDSLNLKGGREVWKWSADNGMLCRQFPHLYNIRCAPLFRLRGTRNLNPFFQPLFDFEDDPAWVARAILRGEL